jgi:hypothetical protein
MADFRKLFFAFAAVALLLSLGTSAYAQNNTGAFACVANAAVPPIIRAEGVTELVGDLILNCTGGQPTAVGVSIPLSNVQIFLNTNVTSRIISTSTNLSEALLIIDEPYPGAAANPPSPTSSQVPGTTSTQLACAALNSTNCTIIGVGVNGLSGALNATPIGANGPYNGTAGRPNIFQGFQNGVNSIAWNGVPIDAPGSVGTRVIRITNVRANACQLGVSSTLIPTAVTMYINVNGSQQVTINNPTQSVASILPGLVGSNKTGSYLQCQNINGNLLSSAAAAGQTGTVNMTATEGFASSFKVRNYAQIQLTALGNLTPANTNVAPQNVFGFPYNTESGYVGSPATQGGASGFGTASGSVGLADTGTQIAFTITGVGAGVNLFVPNQLALFQVGTTSGQTGAAQLLGTSGTGTTQLAVNGTTATAVYEVLSSNVNVLEYATVAVSVAAISNTSQNLPGLGQSQVAVNFNPLSSVPTASNTAPIPRFCQPYPGKNFFIINICSCNLLFPFVTNTSGFDTGIAIANTSLDPFGTATQQGIVTLFYYGTTTGGGAAPAPQKSQTVPAGSELIFTLSGGGNYGITATPGFLGYIISVANFQYCHAFAFISDMGAQKLAEGYLAIQLDLPVLNRTGVVGENEGH